MTHPVHYVRKHPFKEHGYHMHVSAIPTPVGELAISLAKQLAIATGIEDGEDSSGRSKLRLLTPTEAATRACNIADAMYTEFASRGWLTALPEPPADKSAE
jgi:hypothetical protein